MIVRDELNEHRHLPEENPFTYTERLIMIQEALREEGYAMERVFLVPFPIHDPERWRYYVPRGTAMFVVVYSPWERRKADRMRQAGFEVVVEDNLAKGITGKRIRELLTTGGEWERLVPPAVARFLRRKV